MSKPRITSNWENPGLCDMIFGRKTGKEEHARKKCSMSVAAEYRSNEMGFHMFENNQTLEKFDRKREL